MGSEFVSRSGWGIQNVGNTLGLSNQIDVLTIVVRLLAVALRPIEFSQTNLCSHFQRCVAGRHKTLPDEKDVRTQRGKWGILFGAMSFGAGGAPLRAMTSTSDCAIRT